MDIIKSDQTPRKWEWIAEQLKKHEGTECIVEIAEKIDKIQADIYGEHTHTASWILSMRVWRNSPSLINIIDLSSRHENCTACSYSDNCYECEFAKLAGKCRGEVFGKLSLYRQFMNALLTYYKPNEQLGNLSNDK